MKIFRFVSGLILLFAFVFWALVARAQDVSFEASVSSARVSLGTPIELQLKIGGAEEQPEVNVGGLDGFQVRYLGPSTQVMVVNGAYTSYRSFMYELTPLREGVLVIPSFETVVKARVYRTQPITVEVQAAEASVSGGSQGESVILKVIPDKQRVYYSEVLPVTIKLLVRDLALQDIDYPRLELPGVVMGDFERPRQGVEVINGIQYQVIEFATTLQFLRPGTSSVGPFLLNASRLDKIGRTGGIFDDDFFSGFFGQYQKRSVTISSDAPAVEVLSLPEQGRPDDFSGAVGNFQLKAEVAPASVKEGDPLTFKVAVFGRGSLKGSRFPALKHPDFKIYEPKVRDIEQGKQSEQVIIPLKAAVREVPLVKFVYFDTSKGEYVTLAQGPFPVEVLPRQDDAAPLLLQSAALRQVVDEDASGKDLVYIKENAGQLSSLESYRAEAKWFYGILAAYFNVWAAVVGVVLFRRRLVRDPSWLRRLQAPTKMAGYLRTAERYLSAGQSAEFYGELRKALVEYFQVFYGISAAILDSDALAAELLSRGFDTPIIETARRIWSAADLSRFAAIKFDRDRMSADLKLGRRLTRIRERVAL